MDLETIQMADNNTPFDDLCHLGTLRRMTDVVSTENARGEVESTSEIFSSNFFNFQKRIRWV